MSQKIARFRRVAAAAALLGLSSLAVSCSQSGAPALQLRASQNSAQIKAVLQPVDGGASYYAKYSPSLPVSPSFFPIGVWYAGVVFPSDITKDKASGLNTYVQIVKGGLTSQIRKAGMYIINNNYSGYGKETIGWYVSDEADMWGGPGSAAWTGKYPGSGTICSPASAKCGYTVMSKLLAATPNDHRLKYANYGKGVQFQDSTAQAKKFINNYNLGVVTDDSYWMTDDSICIIGQGANYFPASDLIKSSDGTPELPPGLCHLASNYALTVEHIRSLVAPARSKPVWAFIELGHPFKQAGWPSATPQEIRAAVWDSLIGGARGIVYFNHSFGGSCITSNVLRDPCYPTIRAAVTRVDRDVKTIAPVLNAPSVLTVATASKGVIYSLKWYKGHFYLLTGSSQVASQVAKFTLGCVGNAKATVLFENRTVNVVNGVITDSFANSNANHIYRIDGGSNCGL